MAALLRPGFNLQNEKSLIAILLDVLLPHLNLAFLVLHTYLRTPLVDALHLKGNRQVLEPAFYYVARLQIRRHF